MLLTTQCLPVATWVHVTQAHKPLVGWGLSPSYTFALFAARSRSVYP
jgi:hypothetical protein